MAGLSDQTRVLLSLSARVAGISEAELLERLIWDHASKLVGKGEGE